MTDTQHQIVRGYVPGMIGDIVRLHADYYYPQWGLGRSLEADIAKGLGSFMLRYDERLDGIWTVSQQGQVQVAIVIDGSGEAVGEARLRFFIASDALRGQGVGRKLMQTAIDFCDEKRFARVYLKTLAGLESACHLYAAFGFVVTRDEWVDGLHELFYDRLRTWS